MFEFMLLLATLLATFCQLITNISSFDVKTNKGKLQCKRTFCKVFHQFPVTDTWWKSNAKGKDLCIPMLWHYSWECHWTTWRKPLTLQQRVDNKSSVILDDSLSCVPCILASPEWNVFYVLHSWECLNTPSSAPRICKDCLPNMSTMKIPWDIGDEQSNNK
jgi:hypothetical protein